MATKNEKKVIDDKVAKVREVIRNVSTNDIVLALHNFELDVERTIQAFCKGGAETALGDWEKTGAAKKKQQKKKKQNDAGSVSSASSVNLSGKAVGGPPPPSSSSAASLSSINGFSNGYSTTAPSDASRPAVHTESTQKAPINGINTAVPNKSISTKPHKPAAAAVISNTTKEASKAPKNAAAINSHRIPTDADLASCFKELRNALADREHQLRSELENYYQNGAQARFTYDTTSIAQAIAEFGEVEVFKTSVPVSPQVPRHNTNVEKTHSTSHSSLVSSVGEDSGLGQTSPVSQGKHVAHVASGGGIVMESDGLTEDQLADLQRRIEETLKAQGVDPSVLSEFTSSAPRRRQKPKEPRKETRGGAKDKDKGRNLPQVELSILQ